MVELPALTRARQIRLACQASSRRAGWEFRRACAQASSIGHWIDEGENVIRLGTQWGGLGLTLVSLFYPGKKSQGMALVWQAGFYRGSVWSSKSRRLGDA